jgi:PrtD family type I secretion system ABC transporter
MREALEPHVAQMAGGFKPKASVKPEHFLREAVRAGGGPLMFAGAFSLLSNLLYLALPIYTNLIYSRVLPSQSGATLFVLTVGVLLVFSVSAVLDILRFQVLIDFGVIFDRYVSGRVFAALFEGVARRKLSARTQALRDLDLFRNVLSGQAVGILFDVPWIPIFISCLFLINPILGSISFAGSLLLLGLAWLQDRATRTAHEVGQEQTIDAYGFVDSALRNSEVIRGLGMLHTLGAQWAILRNESNDRTARAMGRQTLYSQMIRMLRLWVQIVVIAVGAWLIMEQKVPPGLLFANMIVSARALQPIDRLVASWHSLVSGKAAYTRLNAVIRDYDPPGSLTALPRPEGRLEVDQMAFAMAGAPRLLLSNVNFDLKPGETLGVIGQSGAGKSTLARLLVGVWKPFAGYIRLDGADVYSWERAAFGRFAGYLPQDVELFSGTVRDNIGRFRPDMTDDEVIEAAKLAHAHDMILGLAKGYDTELGEGGAVLSAGQRQRVGLARALFGNPAYVVLDEPNAALDAAGEAALIEALAELKARGVTLVIVSHKMNVFRTADKMLYLRQGRVEMFGGRDQVIARLAPPPAEAEDGEAESGAPGEHEASRLAISKT